MRRFDEMVKISYYKWEIAGSTLRAYGGKVKQYRHNIPVSDFFQIVRKILYVCEKEGMVSKLDILNGMHNAKLSGNRIFNKETHDYKIKIVFDILTSEGFLRHEGIKKYYYGAKGRNPFGYVLNVTKDEIEDWLSKLKEK